MSNENRLSIPDLEDQIAGLQAQLRSQQQRQPALSWYTCTRCSALYTSPWGCGCPRHDGVPPPNLPTDHKSAPIASNASRSVASSTASGAPSARLGLSRFWDAWLKLAEENQQEKKHG